MQRLEITVKASSRQDAYNRYREHLGAGFALVDDFMDYPISDGWVYEVVPDGLHVHYIIGGAWKRHSDEYETDNPSAGTDDTDVYLKALLTAHVEAVSSTQSNVAATSLDIGEAFKVNEITGTPPDEIVKTLIDMGTSTAGEILDYWIVPNRLNGVFVRDPLPFFAKRDSTDWADWEVNRRDIKRLQLSRNIWRLANDVKVGYTPASSINTNVTSGAPGFVLVSATGFNQGDEIRIQLGNPAEDKYWTTMISNLSGTTVTCQDTFPQAAAAGNRVESQSMQLTSAATDSTSQSDYWTREYRERRSDMEQTQAEAYRDLYLEAYANPVQKSGFTISSGYVRDKVGAKIPVWRMLINPGKVRINDLFPENNFTDHLNRLDSFRIVGLDYDHSRRSMRVTPDAFDGDNRIDVLLQQAGFNVGQMVQRGV
jgi:hypothetical protein